MIKSSIWYLTDLDNTLLFTSKKIDILKKYIPYYFKDNKPYSFIEENILIFIKNMIDNPNIEFIPITARSLNSYKNTLFYCDKNIKHYILNHGADIYLNHQLDIEWKEHINNEYNKLNISINEMQKFLKSILNKDLNNLENVSIIENYYIKILWQKKLDIINTDNIMQIILNNNEIDLSQFEICIDGRSWFLKPKFLNKKYALEYLKQKFKPTLLFGSGDSNNDIDFLKICDYVVIPNKAEIFNLTKG